MLEPPCRIGPMRSRRLAPGLRSSLPIWSCSVWGLPCRRHYCRRGALLPHLFTLTTACGQPFGPVRIRAETRLPRRYVFCGTSRPRALKPASRTLSGTLPCGVRTFLPRQPLLAQGLPAATARSSCQCLSVPRIEITSCGRGFWRGEPSSQLDRRALSSASGYLCVLALQSSSPCRSSSSPSHLWLVRILRRTSQTIARLTAKYPCATRLRIP